MRQMAFSSSVRPFPGFARVHLLVDPFSRAFRAELSVSADVAFALARAEAERELVEAHWAMGAKVPTDVAWTTSAIPALLSDRVVEILESHRFTGWRTRPIQLLGKDGSAISGYRALVVNGRCGPTDDGLSRKVDKIFPGGVFPTWFGLYFDSRTWDGSDIFMPAAGSIGSIFVVDEVRLALETAKVKGVGFTPLNAVERHLLAKSP